MSPSETGTLGRTGAALMQFGLAGRRWAKPRRARLLRDEAPMPA